MPALPEIAVYDRFLPWDEYEQVRQSAICSGFGTWTPEAKESVLGVNSFGGVGYQGDHATIFRQIHQKLGLFLYPQETKFRVTPKDAAPSYVHADGGSGLISLILYLSDDKDARSGTGFYRHAPNEEFLRESTGIRAPLCPDRCPAYADMNGTKWGDILKRDMTGENPEDTQRWSLTSFVRSMPNRLICFDSSLYHARLPQVGLGEGDEARMIWVAHCRF